jgi:hypothetical protein
VISGKTYQDRCIINVIILPYLLKKEGDTDI